MRKIVVTLMGAGACAAAASPSAQAQIAFSPCGDSNNLACGHLTVPLAPSGGSPGTLTLAMRRHRAPVDGPNSAVIPLAGGPGQPAIPFTEAFLELLGPIVATRDLIVFDQRGTGLSHPLVCHPGSRKVRVPPTLGQAVTRCAQALGAGRADYTTPDSVADLEAIRKAGGYEKLVLYGTSYGTKVAEQYAQHYPAHVEALVLDSVVPPNGPDPLSRSTFAAVPRILAQLCRFHECAQITRNPVGDLARIVARMRRGTIAGRVIDKRGHPHAEPISSDDLVGILLAGDFDPLLRAEFVPAVRAAADGDSAALARLLARAEGLGEEASGGGVDGQLFLTTTCEEEAFPWSRADSPSSRLSEARAQVDALPRSTFAPFTAANAFDLSVIGACAFWPYSTPAPPVDALALPDVPALILSGESDLRTPTSGALEVAAQIPDSHLLVVPYAGHSVLTNEPSSCASDALQAMFAAHPIKPCAKVPPPATLKLPPLPPARLAAVPPSRGYRGLPGRTLNAVTLTLGDLSREVVLGLLEALGSGSIFSNASLSGGGLRAGWYELTGKTIILHGYSYVPGVIVSGSISGGRVAVGIGGSAAAHGYMRTDSHGALVGSLGGVRVRKGPASAGIPSSQATASTSTQASPAGRAGELLAAAGDALRPLPGASLELAELPHLLSAQRLHEPSPTR
ncbi:MAG TPA: alpha/beta fold hydrolase [Solirubrobacteraceae bacterium]|nr:alpha/beta fold hydrolase [Solirubrobacteraceae bacterium]